MRTGLTGLGKSFGAPQWARRFACSVGTLRYAFFATDTVDPGEPSGRKCLSHYGGHGAAGNANQRPACQYPETLPTVHDVLLVSARRYGDAAG